MSSLFVGVVKTPKAQIIQRRILSGGVEFNSVFKVVIVCTDLEVKLAACSIKKVSIAKTGGLGDPIYFLFELLDFNVDHSALFVSDGVRGRLNAQLTHPDDDIADFLQPAF